MNLSALRFKIQGQILKINYWLPNLEGIAVTILSLLMCPIKKMKIVNGGVKMCKCGKVILYTQLHKAIEIYPGNM